MTLPFTVIRRQVDRDHKDRPLIIPPGGGKPTAYARTTKFIECLEDPYTLTRWHLGSVARGVAHNPAIADTITGLDPDADDYRRTLSELVDKAHGAAGGNDKRERGTRLHTLTERLDRGEALGVVTPTEHAAVAAYAKAMEAVDGIEAIEELVVLDDYKVAGTPDRIVNIGGTRFILDLKTGSVAYGQLRMSMQLACYANSAAYDLDTGERSPLDVYPTAGIIAHLDVDQGTCDLHWIDLARGWAHIPLCAQVRASRNVRDLMRPLTLQMSSRQPA
jgi:hypothetical protein